MNRLITGVIVFAVMGILGGCGGGGSSGSVQPPPPPPPPPADTTPPTVTTTSPGDGAAGVNRLGNITATFDEALNAATVDETSFSVVDEQGQAVSGTVSLDAGTNTATFTPDDPLSLISSYTVTLSTAITDAAGNALASAEVWTFTAADGGWKVAEAIDVGGDFVEVPEIAVDANGNVIAVWLRLNAAGNLDVFANRFSATSAMWGTPQLLETGDGLALDVRLSMDPDGNAIAIWFQEDTVSFDIDIWANRYDTGNASWDAAPTAISDTTGVAINPSLAIGADGSAVVVWEDIDVMGDVHIHASRYSAGGNAWSPSVSLDDGAAPVFAPVVAMDGAGDAIVAWEQETMLGSAIFDVKVSRYSAAGNSWGGPATLDAGAGDAFAPMLDLNAAGDAVIAWEQEAVAGSFIYDIVASTYSAAGGVWAAPQIIDAEAEDATGTSAVIDAAGNVTVAWQQDDGTGAAYDIVAARRSAAGGTWGMPMQLDSLAGDANFPRLAAGVDGDAIVVWQQFSAVGDIELFARSFVAANGVWGAEVSLANDPGDAFVPTLATDANGNGVVVWAHNDPMNVADIVGRRYVAATDTWSTTATLSDGNGDVGVPSLSVNPNGVTAVAWQQVNVAGPIEIFGNRFD